jgi:nucleotide-binding universal stress UspA family protein
MPQDLAHAGWQHSPGQPAETTQVIVVGLDGSPASWDAFCWAAGQTARARGSLIAVHVTSALEPLVPVDGCCDYAYQARQEVAAQLKVEAEQRAVEAGVHLSFVLEIGDPVHALINVARSAHADLVVVGRSAKLMHHLVGSASRRLVSRRDAPVVVVVP